METSAASYKTKEGYILFDKNVNELNERKKGTGQATTR